MPTRSKFPLTPALKMALLDQFPPPTERGADPLYSAINSALLLVNPNGARRDGSAHRAAKRGAVSETLADQLACAVGLHPAQVWPELWLSDLYPWPKYRCAHIVPANPEQYKPARRCAREGRSDQQSTIWYCHVHAEEHT